MRSWKDYYRAGCLSEELVKEKPIIAIYGAFQIGKSTLLNCLLGRYAALTGKGLATTALTARYRWGEAPRLRYRTQSGDLADTTMEQLHDPCFPDRVLKNHGFHLEANIPSKLLETCHIVDTPGFEACDADTAAAMSILSDVHYILFVIPNRSFTQTEKRLLLDLTRRNIPVSILMNCVIGRREERWIPNHSINQKILEENESWLRSAGVKPVPVLGRQIYPCNFLFYWFQQPDFQTSMAYIDRPDTVERHIRGLLQEENLPDTPGSILELSGVPRLKSWLENRIRSYDPISHEWREPNE